jgi:hypothetical protein
MDKHDTANAEEFIHLWQHSCLDENCSSFAAK